MQKKIAYIPVITLLRGLAALMVCLYHFICKTTDYITDEITLNIFHFGELGVSMFFMISGIVLPLSMINSNYKTSSWKSFLLKRIIRIEPPYLLAVLLAVIYVYLRSLMNHTGSVDIGLSFKNILLHIGYLVPFFENVQWLNGAFWTLAIEFQYYILLIILFPLMISKKLFYRVIFYTILLIPGLMITTKVVFFPLYASLFLIGILYILKKSNNIYMIEYVIMSIITSFIVYHLLGVEHLFVALFALIIVNYFPNFKQKQFYFLGKISYSLYLIHGLTGSVLINVFSHYFTQSYQKPILIILGLTISIFAAYLMYFFIEKPSQKISASIKYK